jgi:hypothetical protein
VRCLLLLLFAGTIQAQTIHGNATISGGSINTIGFVPASPQTLDTTFFGQHFHHLTNPADLAWPSNANGGNIGSLMLWDSSYWANVETASGVYDWSRVDGYNAQAATHNADVIFTFGHVPAWASSNPTGDCISDDAGSCYPPSSDAVWIEFVTSLVQHACGTRLKYFELWNEIDLLDFWAGTTTQLVHLASVAYPLIHSTANCACANGSCSPGLAGGVNPNTVLSPNISRPTTAKQAYLTNYINAGGSAYTDVVAIHEYFLLGQSGFPATSELVAAQDIAQLKTALAAAGMGAKPLWNTEYSWGNSDQISIPTYTESVRQGFIASTSFLFASLNIARSIWYEYGNCNWGTMYGPNCGTAPNSDSFSGPRITASAYGQVQAWMIGAKVTGCWRESSTGNWECDFTKANNYLGRAVWNENGSGSYTVPAGVTLSTDINGALGQPAVGSSLHLTTIPVVLSNQ